MSMEERIEEEGAFGTYPLLKHEREWNGLEFTRVNIGLAIATWAFLIGGTVGLFVGARLGISAIILGNIVGTTLMAISVCISTSKYGVEQYTLLRSVFGYNGVRWMVLVALLVFGLGWASVLSIMFGRATTNIIDAGFGLNFGDNSIVVSLLGLVAIAISWYAIWRGPDSLNKLNKYLAPGLVILSVFMLYLIFQASSFAEIMSAKPINPLDAPVLVNFMVAVELNIAAGLGWWPIMGSLSRLTQTPRAALWPNLAGVFAAAVLGEIVGLLTALSLGSFDPTVWMVPLGGIVFGIIALAFVAMANVTSIVAFFYSLCVAFRQVGVAEKIKWWMLTIILFIPVAIAVFFPSKIYDNFFIFLAWTAVIFAPLSAIALVDYFMRGRYIDLRALFIETRDSKYAFWEGYNIIAFVSIAAGAIIYYILLDPVSLISQWPFQYVSASVPSFLLAGIVYYILTRVFVIPSGRGGYTDVGRGGFGEAHVLSQDSGKISLDARLEERLKMIESAGYEDPGCADIPIRDVWFYLGLMALVGIVVFVWGYLQA